MKRHRSTVLRLAGIWARNTGKGAAKDCLGNVYEVLLMIEKTCKDIDINRIGVATHVSRYVLNVMRNELRADIRRQHRGQLSLEAVRTKFLTNRNQVEEDVDLRLDYEVFLTFLPPREKQYLELVARYPGLGIYEVAEKMSITINNVYQLRHRLTRKLRQTLGVGQPGNSARPGSISRMDIRAGWESI